MTESMVEMTGDLYGGVINGEAVTARHEGGGMWCVVVGARRPLSFDHFPTADEIRAALTEGTGE